MIWRNHKHPDEIRIFEFDFSAKCTTLETLSGQAVTATPAGLTISDMAVSGQKVQAKVTGGSEGTTYQLKATASSSTGQTLIVIGDLIVQARV